RHSVAVDGANLRGHVVPPRVKGADTRTPDRCVCRTTVSVVRDLFKQLFDGVSRRRGNLSPRYPRTSVRSGLAHDTTLAAGSTTVRSAPKASNLSYGGGAMRSGARRAGTASRAGTCDAPANELASTTTSSSYTDVVTHNLGMRRPWSGHRAIKGGGVMRCP